MSRLGFFTSPPLTVNDVFAWVNGLFGSKIPTIPLPSDWWETLQVLWRKFIIGDLPDPESPEPWIIDVEGGWHPFTTCPAVLDCIAIVIYPTGSSPPLRVCSPASPPDGSDELAPVRKKRAPRKKPAAEPPARKGRKPAKRPREPAGVLARTRGFLAQLTSRSSRPDRRIS
jgi:hypothetical protein